MIHLTVVLLIRYRGSMRGIALHEARPVPPGFEEEAGG